MAEKDRKAPKWYLIIVYLSTDERSDDYALDDRIGYSRLGPVVRPPA